MKNRLKNKIVSAVLSFVMVFLMLPFGAINIVAADSNYSVPTTGHKLLSSYNVLSGTDISSGNADIVSALDIFNRDKLTELIGSNASYTNMHTQYGEVHEGKDMDSLAVSAGVSLSYSIGASIIIQFQVLIYLPIHQMIRRQIPMLVCSVVMTD